jgi:hypothetical protein
LISSFDKIKGIGSENAIEFRIDFRIDFFIKIFFENLRNEIDHGLEEILIFKNKF